jgi:hypothetical protein
MERLALYGLGLVLCAIAVRSTTSAAYTALALVGYTLACAALSWLYTRRQHLCRLVARALAGAPDRRPW